jgi:hypothetical protein
VGVGFRIIGLSGVLMAGLLPAAGCGSALRPFSQEHVEMREYRPLSVPSAASVPQRWERLQSIAAEQAWKLETFDETRGLMIASRPTKESREVREHVRVVLRPDGNEVSVQTEVLEDGEWDTRDFTCGRYEYSRETEIAMRLDP